MISVSSVRESDENINIIHIYRTYSKQTFVKLYLTGFMDT